jgi:hypothetical protein
MAKFKFYWNGMKGEDGDLRRLNYRSQEDGSIEVSEGRDSRYGCTDRFERAVRAEFEVVESFCGGSGSSSDYFIVRPGDPYFADVKAACDARKAREDAKERADLQKKIAKGGLLQPEVVISKAMFWHSSTHPNCAPLEPDKITFEFRSGSPVVTLYDDAAWQAHADRSRRAGRVRAHPDHRPNQRRPGARQSPRPAHGPTLEAD